jgi:hypothetical protein
MRSLPAVLGLILAVQVFGAPAVHAVERICPSIMQPVCAKGAGGTQTFPNSCLAEGAGFTVIAPGSCDGTTSRRLAQNACTKEYLPVCGEKNGVRKTFGNECEARIAGNEVVAWDVGR